MLYLVKGTPLTGNVWPEFSFQNTVVCWAGGRDLEKGCLVVGCTRRDEDLA